MPNYKDPEINQALMDAPSELEHDGIGYIKSWKAGTNNKGNISIEYKSWSKEGYDARVWLDTVTGEVTPE